MPEHRFALRSVDFSRRLDTFLVCAVLAVLGNRTFLIITGYPQLGNGTLHISHAIWGAAMMGVAIIVAVSYLPPKTRGFVAFVGGAGFGWFIDELGKFITRDVNYFYRPTFALIYIVFIVIYLVSRGMRRRAFSADEAVLNGLVALQSAALGELDEPRRREALALIDSTGAGEGFGAEVRRLLADVPALPPRVPGFWGTLSGRVRRRYLDLGTRPWFVRVTSTIMILLAVYTVVSATALALDRQGIHGFTDWAAVISGSVAGVLIIVGVVLLPSSRRHAYEWWERGLLVDILVTQVFNFDKYELHAISTLVVTVVIWLMVRSALRAEREREETADSHAAAVS
jgi:hypothetical protein